LRYVEGNQQRWTDGNGDSADQRSHRSRADGGPLDQFSRPDGGERRNAEPKCASGRECLSELRRLGERSRGGCDYSLRLEEQWDDDQHAIQLQPYTTHVRSLRYVEGNQQRWTDGDGGGADQCSHRSRADGGPLDQFAGPDGRQWRDTELERALRRE